MKQHQEPEARRGVFVKLSKKRAGPLAGCPNE